MIGLQFKLISINSIAHLALKEHHWHFFPGYHFEKDPATDQEVPVSCPASLTPDKLHPIAAASFRDILLNHLRSLFFVVRFYYHFRGWTELMTRLSPTSLHFAHTYPVRVVRSGSPTGGFRWFEADPRPGVEHDLTQVFFHHNPAGYAVDWKNIERAFGIEERAKRQSFDFYICPSVDWTDASSLRIRNFTPGSREELAYLLAEDKDHWKGAMSFWRETMFKGVGPPDHGCIIDEETFARMERLPSTAVGWWVFRPDAFTQPVTWHSVAAIYRNLSAWPGLIMFEL